MQRSLRSNRAQLAPGLTIADNGTERAGATGRIDILARDSRGARRMIEWKAGAVSDHAVSQPTACTGAPAEEEEGEVRGLLVARDFADKARYASRAIPGITLKRYGFFLTFEDRARSRRLDLDGAAAREELRAHGGVRAPPSGSAGSDRRAITR